MSVLISGTNPWAGVLGWQLQRSTVLKYIPPATSKGRCGALQHSGHRRISWAPRTECSESVWQHRYGSRAISAAKPLIPGRMPNPVVLNLQVPLQKTHVSAPDGVSTTSRKPKTCVQGKDRRYRPPIARSHYTSSMLGLLGTGTGPRCTTAALLTVVLTAAAHTISLFAACLRLRSMSDQTARASLRSRLPKRRAALEAKLNEALRYSVNPKHPPTPTRHRLRPPRNPLSRHRRQEYLPTSNKSRDGTTQFFVYATACIVEHGHRYTLAFTWVQRGDTMVTVLERLLDGIEKSGVPIRRLLLDRGFFRSNVLAYLRGRNVPFLMPVMFRGRKPAKGKATTGWRTFLRKKAGWHQHTLMADDQPIRINVCVGYKSYRHHRTGRRQNKKLVFAAAGTRETPRRTCEAYRRRFGIEASYRQLGQARIRTSTQDPLMRLFFVGLALVLRNLWAWLQGLLSGEKPSPRQQAAAKRRQLRRLLMITIEGIQDKNAFDPLLT